MVYEKEPERYYDWMLWKLRKSEKWREMKEYSKNKRIQSTQEKMYKLNDPIWDKRWTAEKTYSQQMQDDLEPLPEEIKMKNTPPKLLGALELDIKELTKCYYDVLRRNKELIEENQKLKEENANLHNT